MTGDLALLNMNNSKSNPCATSISTGHHEITDKPWLIIRHSFSRNNIGFKLHEGDMIKLGKIVFKVKEIRIQDESRKLVNNKDKLRDRTFLAENNQVNINQAEQGQHDISYNMRAQSGLNVLNHTNLANENQNKIRYMQTHDFTSKHSELRMANDNAENAEKLLMKENKKRRIKNINNLPICRICLCEDNEFINPLINPCKCSGTMKYIHLNCLQQCLKSKIHTKVLNSLIIHLIKNLECELCKKPINEKVRLKGQIIDLIDIQKPENNYLVLEAINKEKAENKYLYIIHMKDKQVIKIGRANDSDVRITDISVSRNHANLKLFEGAFYIEDNISKFGTLLQIPENFVVYPNKQLALQIGRTFVLFQMKKTCLAILRCYKSNKNLINDYNEFLEDVRSERKDDVQDILTPTLDKYSDSESHYSQSEQKQVEKELENEIKNVNYTDEIGKTEKSYPIIDQKEIDEMFKSESSIIRNSKSLLIQNNDQIERMRSLHNNDNNNKDVMRISQDESYNNFQLINNNNQKNTENKNPNILHKRINSSKNRLNPEDNNNKSTNRLQNSQIVSVSRLAKTPDRDIRRLSSKNFDLIADSEVITIKRNEISFNDFGKQENLDDQNNKGIFKVNSLNNNSNKKDLVFIESEQCAIKSVKSNVDRRKKSISISNYNLDISYKEVSKDDENSFQLNDNNMLRINNSLFEEVKNNSANKSSRNEKNSVF